MFNIYQNLNIATGSSIVVTVVFLKKIFTYIKILISPQAAALWLRLFFSEERFYIYQNLNFATGSSIVVTVVYLKKDFIYNKILILPLAVAPWFIFVWKKDIVDVKILILF